MRYKVYASFYNYGRLYTYGICKEVNFPKARQYLRITTQNNIPEAQREFAVLLENGYGGSGNLSQARVWYEKAAENNLPIAQYNLGYLLEHGMGGTVDIQKGFEYYQRAVNKNLAISLYTLKLM